MLSNATYSKFYDFHIYILDSWIEWIKAGCAPGNRSLWQTFTFYQPPISYKGPVEQEPAESKDL